MLECKQCEFVTEYRHHLEYHERNHGNVKPFQCDKCTYRCVNRSMLNSHLKSHSSLCHYRCQDCSYATKYCHSLKTHLRKNGHRPVGGSSHGLSSANKQHHHQRLAQMQQHREQSSALPHALLPPVKPSHMFALPQMPPQHPGQPALPLQAQTPYSPMLSSQPPTCPSWPSHHLLMGSSPAAPAAAAAAGASSISGDQNYLMYLRRQATLAAATAAAAAAAAFRQSPTVGHSLPQPSSPFFFPEVGLGPPTPVSGMPSGVYPPTLPHLSMLPPHPLLTSTGSGPQMPSIPPIINWQHHQEYHQYQFHQHLLASLPQPPPIPMPHPLMTPPPSMGPKSSRAVPASVAAPFAPAPRLATPPPASLAPSPQLAQGPLDLRVAKSKLMVQ